MANPLRPGDWLLLTLYALALCAVPLVVKPLMGAHETVHAVNTREMLASGDVVIPTYGGRPWLERPPLPFWITGAFVALTGRVDADWPYRLGSIAVGLAAVLLTAGIAARLFGRGIALLSGLILITMREFLIYATNVEADIFLCAVMTLALAFFARAEFARPVESDEGRFFGRRPWEVLAFFASLGLLNLTKGLFFGTLIAGAVVTAYLLAQWDWSRIRRYLWGWGWLAYLVVSAPWPLLALWRCPGIVELWESDYLGRMSGTYMREPWWYYAANLPWNLFPWTLPALLGLWLARRDGTSYRAWTFLAAWALAPVVGLSLATGKHHHYLLHVAAPWAIFAAVGTAALWRWATTLPVSRVVVAYVLAVVPAVALLYVFRAKVPGPAWAAMALMALWPVVVATFCWGATRPRPVVAGVVVFGLLLAIDAGLAYYWDRNVHRPKYQGDLDFMSRVRRTVEPEVPLLITQDHGPLGASWWLHYLRGRPQLVHHVGFLGGDAITAPAVYLIVRAGELAALEQYGTVSVADESHDSRWDGKPGWRWTLCKVRFRDDLVRVPTPAISPMQATGRAQGPAVE